MLVDAHDVQITFKDTKTLSGKNWLNAKVINNYMGMIVARSENNQEKFKSVYAFVEMLNFIHTSNTPNIKAVCLSLFIVADR